MDTKKYPIEPKNKLHFEFLKSEQEANTTIKRIYSIRGVNEEHSKINLKKKLEPKKKSLSALPFITPKQLDNFFHVNENKSTVQQVAQVKSTTILNNQAENLDLPKINKYIITTDTSNLDEKNWKRFFNSRNKNKQTSSATVEESEKTLENINSSEIEQDSQNLEKDDEDKNIKFQLSSSIVSPSNQKAKDKFKIKMRKPRNVQKLYRLL